ncbi:MAG: tRNA-dihydrouridine synthase family protein [DPANN group archaeon]|nr:tRNA-dihydrouridine synthase family protein [DPANN group archaeon]
MANKFYYMLAPLDDMTESCFRTICKDADLTFTGLISLESLSKKNISSMEKIKFYDATPCTIQIIGQREESLKKVLSWFSPTKGFKGFNLNVGCPDPNFIRQGMGCAMLKRISKIKRMVGLIKDHGYTASIKMRLGLNGYEKDKKAYLNLINQIDADFFVVHARHGKQNYSDKADWTTFPDCVSTGKNIVANGDIKKKEDVDKMKEFGCCGVMIGREAVINPLIFSQLKDLPVEPIDNVINKYKRLLKERNTPDRYSKNIFKFLGNDCKTLG